MIKIVETPEKFKQIYFNMIFWLQPSREIQLIKVFEETRKNH